MSKLWLDKRIHTSPHYHVIGGVKKRKKNKNGSLDLMCSRSAIGIVEERVVENIWLS